MTLPDLIAMVKEMIVGKSIKVTRQTSLTKDDKGNLVVSGLHHKVQFSIKVGSISDWKTDKQRMDAVLYFASNLWQIPFENKGLLSGSTLKKVTNDMLDLGISDKKFGFISTVEKPKIAKPKVAAPKSKTTRKAAPVAAAAVSDDDDDLGEDDASDDIDDDESDD